MDVVKADRVIKSIQQALQPSEESWLLVYGIFGVAFLLILVQWFVNRATEQRRRLEREKRQEARIRELSMNAVPPKPSGFQTGSRPASQGVGSSRGRAVKR